GGVRIEAFRGETADLEQRRKRAAVRLFELELSRGHHDRILREAATIASYYPADRRLTGQLMIALYRGGYAAEALEAYSRHEAELEKATGAQPEAALRDLMYAIARGDASAVDRYEATTSQQSGTPGRVAAVSPRQLPPNPADFTGRDDLVAEARWLLTREPDSTVPVIVVCGPGGIGKSALAVHVAYAVREHYPDG